MVDFEKIQQVLGKEVSRKEFFQHMGVFMLGVVGISGLLAHFSKSLNPLTQQNSSAAQTNGYGARPYGR